MERTQPKRERNATLDQLHDELIRKLAARVSTILQQHLPSSAYQAAIIKAWAMKPHDLGLEEFEKLVTWAARQVYRSPATRSWHPLFERFVEQGVSDRVWETLTSPPLFDPPERSAFPSSREADAGNGQLAHCQGQGVTETPGEIDQATSEDTRRATASTDSKKSDDQSEPQAEATGWGKGSVRLGPRWTTGKKRGDYYDYAVVRFTDDKE